MATVGSTLTPSGASYVEVATPAGQQVAGLFTMPTPGGLITSISAYAGSDGGTSGWVCIWNGAGTLLGSVAVTLNNGSAGWVTGTLATSVFVAGGSSLYIGWQSANGYYFTWYSTSGTTYTGYNSTNPGNLANGGTGAYLAGAYATYTPTGAKVWNGTTWADAAAKVWNGTTWAAAEVSVWNGTTWAPAS